MTKISIGPFNLTKSGKMIKHFLSGAVGDVQYDDEALEIRFIYADGTLSKSYELGAIEFLSSYYGCLSGLLYHSHEKRLFPEMKDYLPLLDYSEMVELKIVGNDLLAAVGGKTLKASNYIEACSCAANYLIGEVKKAESQGRVLLSRNGIFTMPGSAWLSWRDYPVI